MHEACHLCATLYKKAALQEHYTASPKRIPRVVQYLHTGRWIGCSLWCQTSVSNSFWFITASTPQMKGISSYLKASSPLRLLCIAPLRLRGFCLYPWFQTHICSFLWDLPEVFLVPKFSVRRYVFLQAANGGIAVRWFSSVWCCVMIKAWDFCSAWEEKNFSVKLCHLLKYSTPLDPLLLKSKQWGIKHSCKEEGVRKTGFTLLRSNWWWQCAISVFATLKFSSPWVGSWSEAHAAYNVHSALRTLIFSYFCIRKENGHWILPVNTELWNSSSSLLLLLCAMEGGACWSCPSGRCGSSWKVKATELEQKNSEHRTRETC